MSSLTGQAEGKVRVSDPSGLHARPAVKLVQLAAGFDAVTELRVGGGAWTDARSLSKVMKLKASSGTDLFIRSRGAQADDALSAVVSFIEKGFGRKPVLPKPLTNEPKDGPPDAVTAFCTSEGVAKGRPFWLEQKGAVSPKAVQDDQPQLLAQALKQVTSDLETIQSKSDEMGADILEFQLTLLRDEAFIAPVLRRVERGSSAKVAWSKVLSKEVGSYAASGDSIFRSRAADLEDLSRRVLTTIDNEESGLGRQLPQFSTATILLTRELFPLAVFRTRL